MSVKTSATARTSSRGTRISAKNRSVIRDANEIEAVRALVAEAYQNYLDRLKFEEARDAVGIDLGLSSDRVKRYLSREVFSIDQREADRIGERMLSHLHANAIWWSHRSSNALDRLRDYRAAVGSAGGFSFMSGVD